MNYLISVTRPLVSSHVNGLIVPEDNSQLESQQANSSTDYCAVEQLRNECLVWLRIKSNSVGLATSRN
jgi:hypothetical protein